MEVGHHFSGKNILVAIPGDKDNTVQENRPPKSLEKKAGDLCPGWGKLLYKKVSHKAQVYECQMNTPTGHWSQDR